MANYDVTLTSSAAKELEKLSGQVIARIFPRLESLVADPRPSGCKKLRGGDSEWRIRVGDYRVVYTIDDASWRVVVTRIRHRSEAYER
ncbi:MAG: type II toxin-antitoxin system RelE/ParE family toxin [Acidobacteria bacterium]|nr:type II toxin-antitoxin system RelE/ParE family toxin [Acidobacteriota bacterium]